MILYKIENLKRIYGERTVLNIKNLTIKAGKVYSLTGPNGAGKTTLLKILSFLGNPSCGSIEFLGEKVSYNKKQLLSLRRRVVQLDQSPIMFSGTVAENVSYGLRARGISKTEMTKTVDEMLTLVGMKKFLDHDAQRLSGGETKRVALARALAINPEVLICDEPSANVDNENQEMILDVLAKMNNERGTSIIFSTHYLAQSHRLAHHNLLLQNGVLADLINENIFRIKVIDYNGEFGRCQVSSNTVLQIPQSILNGLKEGKLWIDPTKIEISRKNMEQDLPNTDNVLSGHILEIGREKSLVKISLDVGFKLVVHIPYLDYQNMAPMLGEKMIAKLNGDSFNCTGL